MPEAPAFTPSEEAAIREAVPIYVMTQAWITTRDGAWKGGTADDVLKRHGINLQRAERRWGEIVAEIIRRARNVAAVMARA